MSSILFTLPELFASYKKWVSSHPQMASDLETTVKWVSYFIAGRINNSTVVSELVYCLSNLLVLFNDRVICKAKKLEIPGSGDKLKLWLTVLEYSEVFFELSAKKLWGETGKWIIVVVLQIFKCISRLILLFHHKSNMIENPPIPILKRKKLIEDQQKADFNVDARAHLDSVAFTLKRSGKVIRKIESSPPVTLRNWRPVTIPNGVENTEQNLSEQNLIQSQIIAETIYSLKPIAHLFSVYRFGNNTWKPWMVSLFIDLLSLHLHSSTQKTNMVKLSPKQQLQLSKRYFSLLLYLLRSPFYDHYTRQRLHNFLIGCGKKIPLAGLICTPLAHYIPHWQRMYFYMWSS